MSDRNEVTLKEFIIAMLVERDRAVDKALATLNARLDGMNEFRLALKDQQGTYITRSEVIAWIGAACAVMASVFMVIDHFNRK